MSRVAGYAGSPALRRACALPPARGARARTAGTVATSAACGTSMLIGVSGGHVAQDAHQVESAFAGKQAIRARLAQELGQRRWDARAGASHIWT